MIITSARYEFDRLLQKKNGIKAVIDGKECVVPLAEDNTHYQAIQEWAKIEGNNIIDNGA